MESEKNIRYIGKCISRLYRKSLVYLNTRLKDYNISSSEYMYVINIPFEGGVNLTYLSHKLAVDPALTTKAINSLVNKGIVIKVKSDCDKRACAVSLTEEGKRIKPIILDVLNDWVNLMTEGMELEEKENTLDILEYMVDNVSK